MGTSLFSICLEFVASNIHLVESFWGFPDTIGKIIFEESVKKEQFKRISIEDKARFNLQIFFDAYGECGILNSLCLQECHLFVNDALCLCPWLLTQLTCLDLSLCGLGDDHELLPHITTLQRLEVLRLHSNNLSDNGIRIMTASMRFQKRTHSLEYIDLSSNNITTRSLQFMKVFPNMSVMDVSNTSIGDEMCLSTSRFSFHDSCSCCDLVFCIDTKGWAKQVLNCWKQEYNKCPKPSDPFDTSASVVVQDSSRQASSALHPKAFYSRRRPPAKVQNNQNSSSCVKKDTLRRLLVTNKFHCSLNKEPALDHRQPLFNENSKNISPSHPESLSPSGGAVLKYSATGKKLKGDELPSLSPHTSKTSNSVVNSIDSSRQGMKRKGMNDSSQDKRFRFLNSKEKTILTSLCVSVPSLGKEDRTSSSRSTTPKTNNSISLLDLYSGKETENTGERKLDTGKTISTKLKNKKSLLEELDQLF